MSELNDHVYGPGVRQHDREPDLEPIAGEESGSVTDDTVYDPGPSFVEDDRPTERLAEMPAWLQTFAAAAIEEDDNPEEDAPANGVSSTSSGPGQSTPSARDHETVLPDWLNDPGTRTDEQSEPVHLFHGSDDFGDPQSIPTGDFISEDDLPDWLRAFSEETSPQPTPPSIARRVVPQTATAVSATMVRVPPVENVWLSTYERQALGPGPQLFALLASNTVGDSGYIETAGDAPQQEASTSTTGQPGSRTSLSVSEEPGVEGSSDAQPEAAPQRNSLRLLLITLLVVLVLVILSAQFLS